MSRHIARRAPALSFQCERLALLHPSTTPKQQPVHLRLCPRERALHTSHALAAGSTSSSRTFRPSSTAKQPAPKAQLSKQIAAAMRTGQGLNEDLGIMPDTIVWPSAEVRRKASWSQWTRMLRVTAWTRMKELMGASIYRYWQVRPRPKLEYFAVTGVAKRLYTEMYEAFAVGALPDVKDRVCAGLYKNLEDRVRKRAPGVTLQWRIVRHVRRPKVMSFKAGVQGAAAKDEQIGLKQAVVRFHTVQSLRHIKKGAGIDAPTGRELVVDSMGRPLDEDELAAGPVMKESVEYVVVQKLLLHSQEKEWKIWGTTQETPLAYFDETPVRKLGLRQLGAGRVMQ